jgi:hypothetical protein
MLQISRDTTTNVTKGLLINIALEKRNAQLICSSDGHGLETLINLAIKNFDVLVMKIVRNIASHEGPIHEMFVVCVETRYMGTPCPLFEYLKGPG